MTKQQYLNKLAALYRVANMADSDNPERPDWVQPDMAGIAGCALFDAAIHAMVKCGAITADDRDAFYDNL